MCALIGIDLNAQTTKVKGRVTEFGTGEPLPFVAVYFEGTTIGVTTDLDGYYSMETRDSSACMLTASLLGYEPQTYRISRGAFSEIDYKLRPVTSALNAAIVTPRPERPGKARLLSMRHLYENGIGSDQCR